MKIIARFLVFVSGWAISNPAMAADVRLVFWYERARPLDTFKFQSYDLRKKQFTPEVERWMVLMKRKYPGYDVYTREIDLSQEHGATDNLKIGSAITREFLSFGALHGASFAGYSGPSPNILSGTKPSTFHTIPRVGNGPLGLSAPPALYPVPMPYPRPHP